MTTRDETALAIVLAAGESRRMGRPKQLLPVCGRPMLQLVVDVACRSCVGDVLIVLGADADNIRRQLKEGRGRFIVNDAYAEGMASSLRAGLAAAADHVQRAVILLGDQPTVTPRLIDELLRLQLDSGRSAAATRVGGLVQPPAVLHRELWREAAAVSGDVGLRSVLRGPSASVATIHVDADQAPLDVDTPAEYLSLLSHLG